MSTSPVAPEHSRIGILTSTPYAGGPAIVQDLVCCVHCGYTWIFQPGSGRRRGFCMRCCGLVCGHKACEEVGCVHRHQQFDNLEQGRPDNYNPIIVLVQGTPPRE